MALCNWRGEGGVKKCLRKIHGTWCDLSLWKKKLEPDWVFMTVVGPIYHIRYTLDISLSGEPKMVTTL